MSEKYLSKYGLSQKDISNVVENVKDPLHLYDVIGTLHASTSTSISDIMDDINNDKIGWNSCVFKEYVKNKELDNIFNTRPATVVEGVHTCRKCKGKKVAFYSLQIRSGDEPATNFYTCINCGSKWKGL